MDLKELIDETLSKLDDMVVAQNEQKELLIRENKIERELESPTLSDKEEKIFLDHMRERLLVLFEALQSDDLKKVESKLDITLNYLEYLLSLIEERKERKKFG
jgi:hypothetical protein